LASYEQKIPTYPVSRIIHFWQKGNSIKGSAAQNAISEAALHILVRERLTHRGFRIKLFL
jgi:hypothetical protein